MTYGCEEATRNAERFPWPGHIRKFAMIYRDEQGVFLGPPMMHYPEVPQAEREAAQEYSEKLRQVLDPSPDRTEGSVGVARRPEKPLKVVPSKRTIEEQKEILKKKGLL